MAYGTLDKLYDFSHLQYKEMYDKAYTSNIELRSTVLFNRFFFFYVNLCNGHPYIKQQVFCKEWDSQEEIAEMISISTTSLIFSLFHREHRGLWV